MSAAKFLHGFGLKDRSCTNRMYNGYPRMVSKVEVEPWNGESKPPRMEQYVLRDLRPLNLPVVESEGDIFRDMWRGMIFVRIATRFSS